MSGLFQGLSDYLTKVTGPTQQAQTPANGTPFDLATYNPASDQRIIDRKNALAKALMDSAGETHKGQVFQNAYGTFYGGGNSALTGVADMLSAYLGKRAQDQSDALANEKDQKTQDALNEALTNGLHNHYAADPNFAGRSTDVNTQDYFDPNGSTTPQPVDAPSVDPAPAAPAPAAPAPAAPAAAQPDQTELPPGQPLDPNANAPAGLTPQASAASAALAQGPASYPEGGYQPGVSAGGNAATDSEAVKQVIREHKGGNFISNLLDAFVHPGGGAEATGEYAVPPEAEQAQAAVAALPPSGRSAITDPTAYAPPVAPAAAPVANPAQVASAALAAPTPSAPAPAPTPETLDQAQTRIDAMPAYQPYTVSGPTQGEQYAWLHHIGQLDPNVANMISARMAPNYKEVAPGGMLIDANHPGTAVAVNTNLPPAQKIDAEKNFDTYLPKDGSALTPQKVDQLNSVRTQQGLAPLSPDQMQGRVGAMSAKDATDLGMKNTEMTGKAAGRVAELNNTLTDINVNRQKLARAVALSQELGVGGSMWANNAPQLLQSAKGQEFERLLQDIRVQADKADVNGQRLTDMDLKTLQNLNNINNPNAFANIAGFLDQSYKNKANNAQGELGYYQQNFPPLFPKAAAPASSNAPAGAAPTTPAALFHPRQAQALK